MIVRICPSDDTCVGSGYSAYILLGCDEGDHDSLKAKRKLLIGLDWDFNTHGEPKEGYYWPCDLDKQIFCACLQYRNLEPATPSGSNYCKEGLHARMAKDRF